MQDVYSRKKIDRKAWGTCQLGKNEEEKEEEEEEHGQRRRRDMFRGDVEEW